MLDTVLVYLLSPLLLTLAELGDLEVLKSYFLLLDLSPNFLVTLKLLNLEGCGACGFYIAALCKTSPAPWWLFSVSTWRVLQLRFPSVFSSQPMIDVLHIFSSTIKRVSLSPHQSSLSL